MYDPVFKASADANGKLKVEMSTELEGLDIYYSFDNSFPDNYYPKYSQALIVPKDVSNLKVVTYRGKQQVGRQITIPVEELKKRAKIKS